jgi:hypothetical protein
MLVSLGLWGGIMCRKKHGRSREKKLAARLVVSADTTKTDLPA